MTATECALDLDAAALKTMAGELTDLLRLKSLPFGLKLYEDIDEMAVALPIYLLQFNGYHFRFNKSLAAEKIR